jgi:hypothetical protein
LLGLPYYTNFTSIQNQSLSRSSYIFSCSNWRRKCNGQANCFVSFSELNYKIRIKFQVKATLCKAFLGKLRTIGDKKKRLFYITYNKTKGKVFLCCLFSYNFVCIFLSVNVIPNHLGKRKWWLERK